MYRNNGEISPPGSYKEDVNKSLCIYYDDFHSHEELERITRLVDEKIVPLIPHWALSVTFLRRECEDKTRTAQCDTAPDYRSATISIFGLAFFGDNDILLKTLMHEMVHVIHSPFMQWERDFIIPETAKGNEELGAFLEKQRRWQLEQFTEDMTQILYSLSKPQTRPGESSHG